MAGAFAILHYDPTLRWCAGGCPMLSIYFATMALFLATSGKGTCCTCRVTEAGSCSLTLMVSVRTGQIDILLALTPQAGLGVDRLQIMEKSHDLDNLERLMDRLSKRTRY